MEHAILFRKMMKIPLLVVVIATFVAGCGSAPPVPRALEDQSNNLVGSRSLVGTDCPVR